MAQQVITVVLVTVIVVVAAILLWSWASKRFGNANPNANSGSGNVNGINTSNDGLLSNDPRAGQNAANTMSPAPPLLAFATRTTPAHVQPAHYATATIFISIASYRDAQCKRTLWELFRNADFADRLFVGVFEQNNPQHPTEQCAAATEAAFAFGAAGNAASADGNKMMRFLEWRRTHIRSAQVAHTEAAGPAVARFHCAQLYRGEHFYLQLDSHMRFLPGWDTSLLHMWHECSNSITNSATLASEGQGNGEAWRVVLSQYPLEFDVKSDKLPPHHAALTTAFCSAKFNDDGIVQPMASEMAIDGQTPSTSPTYRQSPFIAAGMLFAPGHVLREVPLDPSLSFLFHGEEMLYSVRLFCAGYKVFSPPRNVIFHYYERPTEPKVWQDNSAFTLGNQATLQQVKQALGLRNTTRHVQDSKADFSAEADMSQLAYAPPMACVAEFYRTFGIDVRNRKCTRSWC